MSKKKAAFMAACIVTPIWVMWYQSVSGENLLLTALLVFPLLPGHVTTMAIAGANDMSPVVDTLAVVAGIGVNILVYMFLILGVVKLFRKLFKRPTSADLNIIDKRNSNAHSRSHRTT